MPARAQGLQRRRASTRRRRRASSTGFGSREFDAEGRYLEAHFAELTVISVYLPSGSSGPHRQASKFRFLEAFLPHLAKLRKREARDHPLRRLEHRAPGDRPQELAQQPEELRLPARGARVAHARVRRAGLRRRVPPHRSAARPVHLVVEPRRRRGRRTSAGGSTTRSPRPASRRRRRAAAIYTNRRFSDHAPLVIDYDYELVTRRRGA